MTKNVEIEIFEIISNGGNAKAIAYEGLSKAHEGKFDEAEQLLKDAHEELNKAHNTQTRLIQAEMNGEASKSPFL